MSRSRFLKLWRLRAIHSTRASMGSSISRTNLLTFLSLKRISSRSTSLTLKKYLIILRLLSNFLKSGIPLSASMKLSGSSARKKALESSRFLQRSTPSRISQLLRQRLSLFVRLFWSSQLTINKNQLALMPFFRSSGNRTSKETSLSLARPWLESTPSSQALQSILVSTVQLHVNSTSSRSVTHSGSLILLTKSKIQPDILFSNCQIPSWKKVFSHRRNN